MAGLTGNISLGGLSGSFGIVVDEENGARLALSVGSGLSNGYAISSSGGILVDIDGNIEYTGYADDGYGLPTGTPISMTFIQHSDGSHSVTLGVGLNDLLEGSVTLNYIPIQGDDWNDWEFENFYNLGSTPSFDNAESITSPLVVDLDGDGIESTSVNDGVYFDHDANGFSEKTGWVSSDDGILVIDKNGDGLINNGNELFGNNTVLADGSKATNGFEALMEYDAKEHAIKSLGMRQSAL